MSRIQHSRKTYSRLVKGPNTSVVAKATTHKDSVVLTLTLRARYLPHEAAEIHARKCR